MRTNGSRVSTLGLVLVTAFVMGIGVAGACPQPRVVLGDGRSSGPVGTKVMVNGTDMGTGPVTIRWNGRTGMELGQASGPSFSVGVTIPEAPAGVHYIVAAQTLGSTTASVAFEVTDHSEPSSGGKTAPSGGRTTTSANGAEDEPTPSTASRPGTAPVATEESGNRDRPETSAATQPPASIGVEVAASPTTSPGVSSTASVGSAPVASTGATPAPPARAAASSANPAALVAASGQVVFGGSQAEAVDPGAGVLTGAAGTVTGDTWSGFASTATPSLLEHALAGHPSPGGSPSVPAVGIALLGAGLVAVFAGFALAEARRKRVLAASRGAGAARP